jgi:TonB family protein
MHTADRAENDSLFAHLLAPSPRRRWGRVVVGASVVVHAAVIAALIVAGQWQIEKLRLERTSIVTAASFGIPGPAAMANQAPPAARKRAAKPTEQKRKAFAQPTDQAVQVEQSLDDSGSLTGSDDGREDGSDDGIPGGIGPIGPVTTGAVCAQPPCGGMATKPPPTCANGGIKDCGPPEEEFVPPDVARGLRTRGNTQIFPSDGDKDAMSRNGDKQVMALIKLCLDTRGEVTSLSVGKSSGYPDYDQRFIDEMRDWQYKPYSVDGKPVPVCGMVTFVYRVR